MSLVATRLALTHQVTIERDGTSYGAADYGTGNYTPDPAWGVTSDPSWQALSVQPCRYWTQAGREAADATTIVVVEDMRVVLPLGTDVTEKDRLGDITYRDAVIAAGPIQIRAILEHQDHLELILERVSG